MYIPEDWRERFKFNAGPAVGVNDLEPEVDGVGEKTSVSSEEVKPFSSSIVTAKSSSFSASDELTVALGLLGHFFR